MSGQDVAQILGSLMIAGLVVVGLFVASDRERRAKHGTLVGLTFASFLSLVVAVRFLALGPLGHADARTINGLLAAPFLAFLVQRVFFGWTPLGR